MGSLSVLIEMMGGIFFPCEAMIGIVYMQGLETVLLLCLFWVKVSAVERSGRSQAV